MRPLLALVCLAAVLASPAVAGRNAHGWILPHTNDAYTYSLSTRCTTPFAQDVDTCEEVIVRSDKSENAVVWLLAGWPSTMSPGVVVIYHGIEINVDCLSADIWWLCGPAGSLEIPDATWPDGTPEGDDNSVAFGSPIYDLWFPYYGFRVSESCGTGAPYWCTSINHVGGYASFVDDSDPPVEDRIYAFGCVGWYGGHGYKECIPDWPGGACCLPDGSCVELEWEQQCLDMGGLWMPEYERCDPNPCPQPDVCCFPDHTCEMITEEVCSSSGGVWHPEFEDCDPNPCLPSPARETTWGRIKADYR